MEIEKMLEKHAVWIIIGLVVLFMLCKNKAEGFARGCGFVKGKEMRKVEGCTDLCEEELKFCNANNKPYCS